MKFTTGKTASGPATGTGSQRSFDPGGSVTNRRRLSSSLALCVLAIIVGAGLLLAFRFSRKPPSVPVPPELEKLEPQLRDYVVEKVKWVQDKPRSSDRQATLGLVYAANSLWLPARLAFSNVVESSPREPLGHLYLAVATLELGDANESARLLRDLTTRFPKFAPGFYRWGEASLRLGLLDDAEKAFQRLMVLDPTEWRGYAGLGEVQLRRGQNAEAARLLERAIQLDPQARSAHNLLGLAYRALGRMEDAKLELTLGLDHATYPMPDEWSKRVPEHMKLLQDQFEMATELAQAGEADKAVLLLEKALVYHPDHLGVLNNLAIALNRAGEPRKARAVAKRALKLNDKYLPAYITLSFSCQALNDNQTALESAERAIQLSPTTSQAYLAKANALVGMERDREAVDTLESAVRCDPKNAEIQLELGDILWRNLNSPDQARQHYQSATNLNPALAPAYVRLADLHLQQGETNQAAPLILFIRRLAPETPELPILERRAKGLAALPSK